MEKNISREFKENGFIILRNVFESNQLDKVRNLIDRIEKYSEQKLEDPFLPWSLLHRSDQGVLYDLFQRHPEFRNMAENDRVLDALESSLGKDIYLYDNSLIFKPTGKKNGVPWHQDFISRPTEPLKTVVWMPIDDVDKENGTLKVIPGSHKSGFMPWYRVQGETHHDRIQEDALIELEKKAQYVNLKAGDVLLFHMLLIHGSDEVASTRPRRVFRCSFQSMEDKIFTPRQSPIVMRGGSPEFMQTEYSNLRDDTPLPIWKRAIRKAGRTLVDYANKK